MKEIENFDRLPDSALVDCNVLAALIGLAPSSIARKRRNEPDFPQPVRLGPKCTRWRVGDLRQFLAKAESEASHAKK